MSMDIVCAIFNSFASKKFLAWTSLCFNHAGKDEARRGQHKSTGLSQPGRPAVPGEGACVLVGSWCPGLCLHQPPLGPDWYSHVGVCGCGGRRSRRASVLKEQPVNFRHWQPSVFRTAPWINSYTMQMLNVAKRSFWMDLTRNIFIM